MKKDKKHVQTLREDVEALGSDLKALLETLKTEGSGKVSDVTSHAMDQLKDRYNGLREAFDEAKEYGEKEVGEVKHEVEKAVGSMKHEVEKRPMTSVLIALGAGLLLGRLLRR